MSTWNQNKKEEFRSNHPVAMPRLQSNHSYAYADLRTYFNLIYASDHPEYKGMVTVAARHVLTGEMRLVGVIPAEQLGDWAVQMHVSKQYDYYYSKSQHKGNATWGTEGTFCFNALYVDIDAHSGCNYDTEKRVCDLLTAMLPDLGCPAPNIIESSGRGIHLVWLIDQVPAALGWMVRAVSEALASAVKSLVLDYGLIGYTVDAGYAANISGLTRIPGTYNTAARTYATYDIYHTQRLDLPKIYESLMVCSTSATPSVVALNDVQRIGLTRAESLRALNRLRPIEAGYRDLFLLHIFSAYQMAGLTNEVALERALATNRTLAEPLSEREVTRNLSTAMRKRYHFTNTRIIADLDISEDEQQEIGLLISQQRRDSNRARKARNAKKKYCRDRKIMRLHLLGMSVSAIAERVGHAYNTVKKVVEHYQNCATSLFTPYELKLIARQRVGAIVLAFHKAKESLGSNLVDAAFQKMTHDILCLYGRTAQTATMMRCIDSGICQGTG